MLEKGLRPLSPETPGSADSAPIDARPRRLLDVFVLFLILAAMLVLVVIGKAGAATLTAAGGFTLAVYKLWLAATSAGKP